MPSNTQCTGDGPFKTNVHSLQTRSCSRAIGSSPSYCGQKDCFIWSIGCLSYSVLQRRENNHCLMLKSNQTLEQLSKSTVSVQCSVLALSPKPTQLYQVQPLCVMSVCHILCIPSSCCTFSWLAELREQISSLVTYLLSSWELDDQIYKYTNYEDNS